MSQILVAGMHRSGTSIAARLLNLLGAYFGPPELAMPAKSDNPRGFWERKDVFDLNGALLAAGGAAWNRVLDFDPAHIPPAFMERWMADAAGVVAELDGHRPWFLKDPRFCITLPWWLPHLDEPALLITYRNPVEIARSLEARNGIPILAGVGLAELHYGRLLQHSSGLPRQAVFYDRMIGHPRAVCDTILAWLDDVGASGVRVRDDVEVEEVVDPGLYRQRVPEEALGEFLNQKQLHLHHCFRSGYAFAPGLDLSISAGGREALRAYELGFEGAEDPGLADADAVPDEAGMSGLESPSPPGEPTLQ